MKHWLKIMIWVICIVIAVVIIGYGGCVGCIRCISTSNSCAMFNIDNIELCAHIDIPEVVSGVNSCKLDKEENTKTNYFKIRTDVVDMDRYIERNSFVSVNEMNIDLSVFGKLSKTPNIMSDNVQNYYYNLGEDKWTNWLAIVDKSSGDLWVYMKYKD